MKTPFLFFFLTAFLTVLIPSTSHAQRPTQKEIAELAVKHNEALAANRRVMDNYSWNYRIEVQESGVVQWVDLMNITFGANGQPVFTQINREQIVEQSRGLFGKKKKQEKGFEEKDRIIAYVIRWINAYNRLPADRVHTLFRKAAETGAVKVSPGNPNIVGLSADNVRDSNANDRLGLWFNKANGHPISFTFTVPVEKSLDGATGQTLSATINYRYLQNGEAFYPDHVDVSIPSRQMRIKVENLNMQKKL